MRVGAARITQMYVCADAPEPFRSDASAAVACVCVWWWWFRGWSSLEEGANTTEARTAHPNTCQRVIYGERVYMYVYTTGNIRALHVFIFAGCVVQITIIMITTTTTPPKR